MAGVYCPSCEAGVEPASKFCLSCGNDLTVRGPITATGHDLNQLKDVIRTRDDLSMAEKFDMIAKVEEGANPILLGIAAPADDDEVDIGEAFAAGESETVSDNAFKNYQFGESAAASAAVRATVRGTDGWVLVQSGDLNLSDGLFRDAMNLGMEASTHIHDVSSGGLLVALSEMSIGTNFGIKIQKPKKLTNLTGYFFGEDQGRYVIEIDPSNLDKVVKLLNENNIYHDNLGVTQKEFFEIEDEMKISNKELFKVNNHWYNNY